MQVHAGREKVMQDYVRWTTFSHKLLMESGPAQI